ncbi:uncharacterized protein LOC116216047 isoform X2 [Punica granatum]|uniref:Uncharacterized protein LOC116216047 isoform X2 n=1 Tax=Punica granatum TaxID=22663 RepID=A0A6P8ENG6_PUNGR|nr:uncharacterized protein LOC116216047 isoform X2 [Punica granatum]
MSRPRVTITLGRSGQVVKREGNAFNESRFNSLPSSGSKRLIRDRLGGNANNVRSGSHSNAKRQRGDINGSSNGLQEEDLRVKLMQKNKAKQVHGNHNNMSRHGNISTAKTSTLGTWSRQHMRDPEQESSLRRISPTRSADDLLQLNAVRKSYSSWDGQRHGSPDRIAGASREFSLRYGSPDSRIGASMGHLSLKLPNGQHQVLSHGPVEVSQHPPYAGKNVYDHVRPLETRTTLSVEATRPIPRQHPQSSMLQQGSYLEPLTIGNFLNSLGLGKYAILFQAEEIDMTVLKHMQDNDLKELGIPMGPRRKILLSLSSLSRRM